MEIIATIASVIAALAAIITLCFTYKTSRTNIRKKIACKNKKISEIDRRIFLSQSKSVSFLQKPTKILLFWQPYKYFLNNLTFL